MKLTTKTGLSFISSSAIFFLFGSVFMYYAVRVILAEDLSSRLYQMQNDFIENLHEDNDINLLKSKHVLINQTDKNNITSFSDTVLIEYDQYVLYRKIRFYHSFNNSNYRIEILQSQAQTDLLIWRIVILNVALAMSFFLIIFFLNHLSVKRGLRIFYKTVSKLESYNIGKPELISFENSEIDELNKLTDVFKKMTLKISNDYKEQKEYTENVSHEIQTPLAIISAKADELLQSENLKKTELEQLEVIMNTTTRLAKINQALILLTKIDNRFYTYEESIPLLKLINEKLNFFKDLLSEKKVKVKLDIDSSYTFLMNSYLADTLFLNLIKNAIMHNVVNGEIIIKLDLSTLSIINTGQELNITDDIFKRFIRSENKDSLGIGLSIVKKICGYYSIHISYNFNKDHEFTLIFEDGK
ncbi:HAMP domain-containing sensor histidine kinase [Flavobacteriales bacterium]|nr:HAMP domain-containing sensor histidine kinase [Flavobacteriales bacterium]